MTVTAILERSASVTDDVWSSVEASPAVVDDAVPPLSPRLQLVRGVLVMLFIVSFSLVAQLVVISGRQHAAGQRRAFEMYRGELARGTAPIGPTDSKGRLLALGTSVAFLEIPSIGVREVVGEGTTSSVLFRGPGHKRDTPLPGQIGTSQVFGRRAAFGGPFADIAHLKKDDLIRVTTGQGIFEFRVLGVRHGGDPVPAPPAKDGSRLVLTTASGAPFLPSGVVRVDADLTGAAVVGPERVISSSNLPAAEQPMAGDTRSLWVLALWLQALVALALGAVWAWHRWGRAEAWVVFLPPLMLVGLFASGEFARLLPNMF